MDARSGLAVLSRYSPGALLYKIAFVDKLRLVQNIAQASTQSKLRLIVLPPPDEVKLRQHIGVGLLGGQ